MREGSIAVHADTASARTFWAGVLVAAALAAFAVLGTRDYHRFNADYDGWQIHTWGAAQDPGWNNGWNASGSDGFGNIYDVPLVSQLGDLL